MILLLKQFILLLRPRQKSQENIRQKPVTSPIRQLKKIYMSEQIAAILKKKLDALSAYGEIDAETRRNALKEELQFYVLNFIYHHPEYNKWIMYGGSALRIIHGLDRMSVDLDFEVSHSVTNNFLEELKKEIGDHFRKTYNAGTDFLAIKITTGRGLLLK